MCAYGIQEGNFLRLAFQYMLYMFTTTTIKPPGFTHHPTTKNAHSLTEKNISGEFYPFLLFRSLTSFHQRIQIYLLINTYTPKIHSLWQCDKMDLSNLLQFGISTVKVFILYTRYSFIYIRNVVEILFKYEI